MNTMISLKHSFICLSLLVIFGFLNSCINQKDLEICDFPEDLEPYTLVWSDEFDGTEIDESKWNFLVGDGCDINLCGWGNNELEWYTRRKENAYLENGNLVIQARKESPFYLGKHQYTSARMTTKEKGDWKYGRMDIRAKLPIGKGMWPAIWMLPTDNKYGTWPKSGEIDIMEYLGDKPTKTLSTIHFGHDYWRYISDEIELETGTFAQDFHTFSVRWKEGCMRFFMDDKQVGQAYTPSSTLPTTWPFQERFHMILNVAVGGNLPGNPDASTQFPQKMEVDYVRVYQEN